MILSLFGFAFYHYMENEIYNDIKAQLIKKTKYITNELHNKQNLQALSKEGLLLDSEVSLIRHNKIIYQTKNFHLKEYNQYLQYELYHHYENLLLFHLAL